MEVFDCNEELVTVLFILLLLPCMSTVKASCLAKARCLAYLTS